MTFDFSALALPLIQAPMAGGVTTPRLVAAVAQAGAVGSFGFAYSPPAKIAQDLAAVRAQTPGPVNANFFVFAPVSLPDEARLRAALEALQALPHAQDCALSLPRAPFFPDLEALLEPVWAHPPAMLTFHFGIPPESVLQRARALGIAVGLSATCLAEAQAIERAGADFIVAQGIEAGGHRGTFDPEPAHDESLGVEALVTALARQVRLPIVAAGGLMDGADIRRVIDRGAVAAQLGTAFLCCDESGASAAHKEFIRGQPHRGTAYTRAFSGRRAQGLRNDFIERMQGQPVLPFPLQNTLTGPLRQAAALANDGHYQSLWAGTAYGRARQLPAAELVRVLAREFKAASAAAHPPPG